MRHLSRAESGVFSVYLLWMSIGLVVTLAQINGTTVESWTPLSPALKDFILECLRYGDPISIILAAINTHWLACKTWGLSRARRWAVTVLIVSALVESVGTLTGWPFGAYHYTENFGPRVAGVLPLVIPFSWLVLVTNVLLLVRNLDYLCPWQESLLAAVGVTFLDWMMEPFAVHIKAYWYWDLPHVPWQNYVAWFGLTFLLVNRLAPTLDLRHQRDVRPPVILGMMLALFISARLIYGV